MSLQENLTFNEARIKVIGIGGAGGNTINRIVAESSNIRSIDLVAVNTDLQVLKNNKANIKLSIGRELTRGLGAGGDPEIGRKAALESTQDIIDILKDSDMILLTCGMGGGTGTGATPVIAELARKHTDAIVIGVFTKPFSYEGSYKMNLAEKAISEIKPNLDAIIVIPNDSISKLSNDIKSEEAYKKVDYVLIETITGITDVIMSAGSVNVDFADIAKMIRNSGTALVGIGKGKGERRHLEAVKKALDFPLIENANIHDAKGLIVYFRCNPNFKAIERREVMDYLNKKAANPDIKIKFGELLTPDIPEDEIFITIIASGFGYDAVRKKPLIALNKNDLYNEMVNKKSKSAGVNNDDFSKPAYLRRKNTILD